MKNKELVPEGFSEILLYTTPNGKVKVEIYLKNETIWLTQQKIADLFGVQRPAVTKHLKNIFSSGELDEEVVSSILEHTTQHGAIKGKTQEVKVKFYNLDAIISIGYRINSTQATAFRVWATERLKEYIIKGFTMDDERLKNPYSVFGKDYFEEQLARIRDIRSSERRFYQKITDIYSQCSADYNVDSQITKDLFASVQNKLHWAITGQTAAEIIVSRADCSKEYMGLTTWKNSPKGSIRKTDVGIAKNYLSEKELDGLNRIVNMYLNYAESQARKCVIMNMKDWVMKLDAFLQFNEVAVLKHQGKVLHEVALVLAETEFEKYRIIQDKTLESDFDKILKHLASSKKDKK
ncbi:MAG: virulence RhuM family protein [Bacteroidales bacterium]|nr:virulence RhuM family protein [Bacteroidales bacterium]